MYLKKELKKSEYVGMKVTPELNAILEDFIDRTEKEIGVRLKKTQAIEALINEGLKNLNKKSVLPDRDN